MARRSPAGEWKRASYQEVMRELSLPVYKSTWLPLDYRLWMSPQDLWFVRLSTPTARELLKSVQQARYFSVLIIGEDLYIRSH